MNLSRSAFIAGAVAAALAGLAPQASAAGRPAQDKCFGVSWPVTTIALPDLALRALEPPSVIIRATPGTSFPKALAPP